MTVYVDDPVYPLGGMMMCHMIADSSAELLEMADAIDVRRRWLQYPGMQNEHFDVCKSKRELAVKKGAKEISGRELLGILRKRRTSKGEK